MSCADSLCVAILVSDDFACDNAALVDGLQGGAGWAGAWSGIGFITPGSLRFPQLAFCSARRWQRCAKRRVSFLKMHHSGTWFSILR